MPSFFLNLTWPVTATDTLSAHLFTAHAETTPAEFTLARTTVLGLHVYFTPAWNLRKTSNISGGVDQRSVPRTKINKKKQDMSGKSTDVNYIDASKAYRTFKRSTFEPLEDFAKKKNSRVLVLFRGAACQHRANEFVVEKIVTRQVVSLHLVDTGQACPPASPSRGCPYAVCLHARGLPV